MDKTLNITTPLDILSDENITKFFNKKSDIVIESTKKTIEQIEHSISNYKYTEFVGDDYACIKLSIKYYSSTDVDLIKAIYEDAGWCSVSTNKTFDTRNNITLLRNHNVKPLSVEELKRKILLDG